jgi:hypothetical protein
LKKEEVTMFWKQWFKPKAVKKSQLTLVAEAFAQIKPQSLSNVFSSDMSIRRLTVCKSSIEEYTELLRLAISAIEHDKLLYNAQLELHVQSVYIRDFFTTKKHMTLEPVKASGEFISLCITFLKLYEDKERLSEKSFNLEKNLLLTQQVISNLCILSKEL